MHPIEQRILNGQATAADSQWLSFLDDMLAPVALADLAGCGMTYDDARRLAALLALAARVTAETTPGGVDGR